MAEDDVKPCDVDDLLCQARVLGHLNGLKSVLGDDRFKSDFPELQALDERVRSREAEFKEALNKCSLNLESILEKGEYGSPSVQ